MGTRTMRATVVMAVLLSPAALAGQAAGGTTSDRAGRRQLAFDASAYGGAVSYAVPIARGRLFGVQVGVGGDRFNRTLLAGGGHYTDDGRHQLEERAHAAVFVRQRFASWFAVDAGARVAPFRHQDLPNDDTTIGVFAGVYAAPMFGGPHVAVGPRVMAGVLSESTATTALGLNVAPLVVRVTFR